MNPIISHLTMIPSNSLAKCETCIGRKLKKPLLSSHKNRFLGQLNALWEKPFVNWYFLQRWHEASHVPTLGTLITNQHGGNPCGLPTQHISKLGKNNRQKKVNLTIHMRKMTWHIITHMVFACLTISTFQ